MALTKRDIQRLKSLITEEASNLRHEIKADIILMKTQIKNEILKEVRVMFNALKIYMDVEFRKMDTRFERIEVRIEKIEQFTEELKDNIIRLSKIAENHENRILEGENRLN
jgi:hypothetical protein